MSRAYMLIGALALCEIVALVILFAYPSSKHMELTSSAFTSNSLIPAKYTCDGEGVSPPLSITGVPEGTQSLALVVDDPDVPKQIKPDGVFDHWVLFNIPTSTTAIPEGGLAGSVGLNGAGKSSYYPLCPPKEYQPSEHRYVFVLYALAIAPTFMQPPTKEELLRSIEGHVVAQSQLVGRYGRQ